MVARVRERARLGGTRGRWEGPLAEVLGAITVVGSSPEEVRFSDISPRSMVWVDDGWYSSRMVFSLVRSLMKQNVNHECCLVYI